MLLDSLINNYIIEDDESEAFAIATQISDSASLLNIVRALGDPLTQEDAAVRSKATQCLADVIKTMAEIQSQELTVLAMFLVDRVEDFASVGAAADGLAELVARPGFKIPDESFWTKLQEINMLDLDQPARFRVFQLLDKLSAISSPEFVSTFVMLASGEKDPQNLMVSLKISEHILACRGTELPRERCAELYDITFCYFPITFNPPKDMEVKITADQIRERLRAALRSPAIAEWVVPGLIGKLTAVNVGVKVDALQTLGAVAEKLVKSGELSAYWKPIWEGTRYEVLHGTPQSETFEPMIALLTQLAGIPQFLEAVRKEFELEDLTKGKLSQLCHLVVGISGTEAVWDVLAPTAVEKAIESAELLNLLLSARYSIPFSDRVIQALLVSLANGNHRESSEGLKLLALQDNEYAPLVVQTLTQEKAYGALAELAKGRADAVKDHCLPQLLSELPASLGALGQICCVRSLVHTLTVRLLSRMDLADEASAMAYLNTLITSTGHLQSNAQLTGYNRVLITPLLNHFRHAKVVSEDLVDAACILIERASRGVTPEHQQSHASTVTSNLGNVHFHLILSGVAAMAEYPFKAEFAKSYLQLRLGAATALLERAAYLRTLSLMANKWPEALDVDMEQMQAEVEAGDVNSLEAFAWLSKGLLFRSDKAGFQNASYLTKRVKSHPTVAKIYAVLMAPDRVLSKENGCVVRALFRQRVFEQSLPVLAPENDSPNTLVALSGLLKYTPQSVVSAHFDKILPLLLASLNLRSGRVQAVALQSLCDSLPESSAAIEYHLSAIIPSLLELAVQATAADVRVTALKTLIAIQKSLGPQLEPAKQKIMDRLIIALGDKRREVRKYAVICRQALF